MTEQTTPAAPGLTSHDRLGHLRGDMARLDELWSDPATRVLVVSGGLMLGRDDAPAWMASAEAQAHGEGTRILLGDHEGVHYFALHVRHRDDALAWVGMREIGRHFLVDGWDTRLVFHALGMSEWLSRTRFCARCGGELRPEMAGHVLRCQSCQREHFPRIEPAVIMLITDGEPGTDQERCLLGSGLKWGPTRFSTLAGFAEPGESLEDAVRREVREESGVEVGEVTWFGSQAWPFPSSLMLGFFGRATSTAITIDPAEIADARWFTRAELREQAESGEIALPGRGISISRSLIEAWYGGELPGSW
ncbi:NAD(+) diphosphatase [Nocardioides jiangxiensis]|uniref:NAD(+) diphosphatase n=1 Tax=Nocardioides jiangxiensis TaxID=3064524 RepID=A0ABT9AXY8_9ACTN|nr:NAD(+) diphosphatase [Nocardioides sp. WY-20]MDO7867432.1 NAD(+) diphosphatase [Nocardioides sp. WY-20]